jgi:hypothetical protein
MAPPAQEAPKDAPMERNASAEHLKDLTDPRLAAFLIMETTHLKREAEDKAKEEPERPLNVALQEAANISEKNKPVTQRIPRVYCS